MTDSSELQHPTAVLRSEHRTILRVIGVLQRLVARSERGNGFEHAAMRACVEFFQHFADACHHTMEEDLLSPVLETRGIPREGGPIGVMLYEHRLARQYTKDMAGALNAIEARKTNAEDRFRTTAHEYSEVLTNHISKEDNVQFNMGDRVMSDDDPTTLCNRFCEVGWRTFDGKKPEEFS